MHKLLEREGAAGIGQGMLWRELGQQIRSFNPDFVVLVARKMPRIFDVIELNLGASAICISDQAIPFVQTKLKDARVAIVDDLWNVGTTMLNAADRVRRAGCRTVRMFALGAKDASKAATAGVRLVETASMTEDRYEDVVRSVPNMLRLLPKPYDADFPIVRCTIRAPYKSWPQCWAWLRSTFGVAVHTTIDEDQEKHELARATVNFQCARGWVSKARLYFDLDSGYCNLVPMALAPSLALADVYPSRSLAKLVYSSATSALDTSTPLCEEDRREALGRLGAFCDSLMILDQVTESLSGLIEKLSFEPFAFEDFAMQFGPVAARAVRSCDLGRHEVVSVEEYAAFFETRQTPAAQPLLSDRKVVDVAVQRAEEGWPAELVFDSLFQSLATAVGAEDPDSYLLDWPYQVEEVRAKPYRRLRIGLTYAELIEFLRAHLKTGSKSSTPEALTSALIDLFVDLGAVVPTITLKGDPCVRVYRKGESNPRWDAGLARLSLAVRTLRLQGENPSRTRVTKIAAILAMSAAGSDPGFRVAAAERGTVATMGKSVAERNDIEITAYMRNLGLWDKSDAVEDE